MFATHPDRATTLFHEQAEILADPTLRRLFLGYDHAHDLDAGDQRFVPGMGTARLPHSRPTGRMT
ncbi:hypothetical protein [Streptomyces erythrochromogenes]|uniref:hypothetical protein n=1 Tax=Streptomyces erythrochromogenes TaxID=285574 RepID=UPI00381B05DE